MPLYRVTVLKTYSAAVYCVAEDEEAARDEVEAYPPEDEQFDVEAIDVDEVLEIDEGVGAPGEFIRRVLPERDDFDADDDDDA